MFDQVVSYYEYVVQQLGSDVREDPCRVLDSTAVGLCRSLSSASQ